MDNIERIVIVAKEGMIYTNGKNFGSKIWIEQGAENNYYQIPIEEYNALIAEREKEYAEETI